MTERRCVVEMRHAMCAAPSRLQTIRPSIHALCWLAGQLAPAIDDGNYRKLIKMNR